MENIPIRLRNGYALIKELPSASISSKVFVTDSEKSHKKGTIVAIAKSWWAIDTGKEIPIEDVKAGDIVEISEFAKTFLINDELFYLERVHDILVIWEN